MGETGYQSVRAAQASSSTCSTGRHQGHARRVSRCEEVVPGPHVSEARSSRRTAARGRQGGAAFAKPATGGDSPIPIYDVYRSYSEPGGIKAEMAALAAQYRGLAKLVVIGKSGQGQDIVALKVTRDARNVADGARPAMLFGRQPRPRVDRGRGRAAHADLVARARGRSADRRAARPHRALVPAIQNPDGYDYTFTCGIGFRRHQRDCGATLVTDPADPLAGRTCTRTPTGRCARPGPARHGAAQGDPPPVAQDPARRRRQRRVRRRPGRRRPQPQLPTAWGLDEEY